MPRKKSKVSSTSRVSKKRAHSPEKVRAVNEQPGSSVSKNETSAKRARMSSPVLDATQSQQAPAVVERDAEEFPELHDSEEEEYHRHSKDYDFEELDNCDSDDSDQEYYGGHYHHCGEDDYSHFEVEEDDLSEELGSQPDVSESPAPFTGTFDLYAMELDFLNKAYSPPKAKSVKPNELYKTILTYQAKSDRTAQITIPDRSVPGQEGKFKSPVFSDPMEGLSFDISLFGIQGVDDVGFKSKYKSPMKRWEGPGLTASMRVKDGGCGISSSSGKISMQPLWKQTDNNGKTLELFEGTLDFKVVYSSMYSRKGHGRGQNLSIAFWAIRALASK